MEIAPKELTYEMVKAMAQHCEWSKRMAKAMREEVQRSTGSCHRGWTDQKMIEEGNRMVVRIPNESKHDNIRKEEL